MIRIKSSLFFSIIFCLACTANQAQNVVNKMDTLLTGPWKGSSICQVKNSPCHDETVVYHISKKKGIDTFFVNASKIINGVEDEMGILPFVYNKKTNQLTSSAYGTWTFNIAVGKLEGTLVSHGNLYRIIKLKKQY